ncbi:MAG TPA: Crp/Fnr family transcriptional regulator [Candidatus Dormibacteraeota bacterium]|nr:Crp/Fnr family transcriptional regulator [Candidatus Dormibacteraeota bacterium]
MVQQSAKQLLASFFDHYPLRSYKKGEIIIFQGEEPRSAFVVKNGIVKAYNLSSSGDEKPVAFYEAGRIFPEAWTYSKLPSAIYYYEAFSDRVDMFLVPRDEYVGFIKSNPQLLYQELEHFIVDQVGRSMRLNALQHSRASDKLVYTLHYLAHSHGKRINHNLFEIELALTHQDFANLTGLTRETAATELNKLKHLGVISYGKRMPYKIKLDKLVALLNDQFIAELEIRL